MSMHDMMPTKNGENRSVKNVAKCVNIYAGGKRSLTTPDLAQQSKLSPFEFRIQKQGFKIEIRDGTLRNFGADYFLLLVLTNFYDGPQMSVFCRG